MDAAQAVSSRTLLWIQKMGTTTATTACAVSCRMVLLVRIYRFQCLGFGVQDLGIWVKAAGSLTGVVLNQS